MFNPLRSSTKQELLKSTSAIKIATITNMDDSVTKGSHHVLSPNQHFAVSKDKWDTKEDTGKSMKNTLCLHLLHSQAH